jgi:hypothetical protein
LRFTLTRPYGVLGGILVVIVAMFWLALRRMLRRRPTAGYAEGSLRAGGVASGREDKTMSETVDVFWSFRSPYSWLASVRLKDLIDAGDTLELVPFFEPDALRREALEARGFATRTPPGRALVYTITRRRAAGRS